jgi:hypothetical protein
MAGQGHPPVVGVLHTLPLPEGPSSLCEKIKRQLRNQVFHFLVFTKKKAERILRPAVKRAKIKV